MKLGSLKTTTEARPEHRAATDSSVYDLPSSDEETKLLPRKRRRNGSNGNTVSRPTYVRPDSHLAGGGSDAHHPPPVKADSGNVQADNGSPRTRMKAGEPRESLKQTLPGGAPATTKNVTASRPASPRTPRAVRTSQIFPDESKSPRSVEASTRLPSSSDPSEVIRSLPGNATPTRRRLIDSLGTTDCSNDFSAKPPIGGLLRSPSALRSPSQPKGIGSPSSVAESQRDGFVQDSTVPHSPHLKGSKVTYARQRSFLDDLPLASGLLSSNNPSALEPLDPLVSPARNAGDLASTRSFAIEEASQDDGSVRSIHELRQAGGNARYRGAVESIFEDIEDPHNSVSGRCNSFTQLCGRILDPRLARQFVECGFDKRLVDCLSTNLDVVSLALAYCALGLIFNGRSMPYLFAAAAWPKLLGTSLILLDIRDDMPAITQSRGSNLSKHVQTSVRDIIPKITSALFEDGSLPKLSPCILALLCLKGTITAYQEKGDNPSGLPAPLLKKLMDVILSEIPRNGKPAVLTSNQSLTLVHGLFILEAHTASGAAFQKEQLDTIRLLSNMHGLLHRESDTDKIDQQVQTLYIRVLLNVTNSYPVLCDEFGPSAITEQLVEIVLARFDHLSEGSLAQENNSLNTVILALGALINVTEHSEATRDMFLRSHSGTQSLLDGLLRLFSTYVESTSKVCLSTFTLPGPRLTRAI